MLAAALAVTVSSCHEDINPWRGSGNGTIAPNIGLNTSVESSKKNASRAAGDVTVNDLALTITSADGSYSNTWTSVADYDPETKFKVGRYTVEATYGNVQKEGFECPAYYGAQEIEVRENEATEVSLTATLANTMVSIDYTDDFKKYMTEWDATVRSTGGQYVYFSQNESRPGYFRPGDISVNVSFATPGGDAATLNVANFTAVARRHYHITVDLNNGTGSGSAILVIIFDEALDRENVEIELNDDLFNAPAPTVTGAGDLTNGSVYTHIVGDEWTTPLKVNVIAQGTMASVKLTTHSASLKAKGWPEEIELLNADEATQARLTQLGFDCKGLWRNPTTMAVLDFTNVINMIGDADDNANNFTVSVTDRMTKVAEPFSFAVNSTPMELSLANASSLAVGATELAVDLHYNGSNPAKAVKFQSSNERGTWDAIVVKSVTETSTAGVYRVVLTVPADAKPVTVRAVTSVKNSESLTVQRVSPQFAVTATPADIWATHATFTVTSDAVGAADLAKAATVFLSRDGTTFTRTDATVNGGKLAISGLNPGTQYTIRVSVTGDVNDSCTPLVFTTETAAAVPNGDFETLTQTLSENGMHQNGEWGITAGIYYQSTLSYTISEPNGWASVNKKTTSGTTRNSWFVVPSTFNSTLTWQSTVPKIKVVGTGGGTETPASYAGFTAHSGNNAMVLRNVAWDPAGDVPAKEYHTTSGVSGTNHFNQKVANVSRISAGRLFLGSYSYSNGTETFNEGTSFTSRPKALTGYYQYTCDSQDASERGIVTVSVLSGSTVIATGSARLAASATYMPFTVALNYVADASKATSVRIMFTSSDKNENDILVTTFNSRYESAKHGATLVVDNLGFTY